VGNQKLAGHQSSGQEIHHASHETALSWHPGSAADPERLDHESHDCAVLSTIAELVSAFVRGAGIEETLTKLTSASVALVPGAEFAKISLIGNGHLRSITATSELIALLDGAQQAAGQGPCLDAVHTQKTIYCSDLRTDVRWPQFARAATTAGVHRVLSCPLDMPGVNGATLTLFGSQPGAFGRGSAAIAAMLADHAAIALFTAERERRFRTALATRDIIGQAKGMLMERFDVDSARAFAMLKTISQQTSTPVRQLATSLIDRARARDDDPRISVWHTAETTGDEHRSRPKRKYPRT
jgi:transcriptional regulator with GAF, ATPase, and Fis domain